MLHVLLFISGHILQLVSAGELLNGTMEFGTDYNDYIFGGYEAETHTPWMAHFGHCGGAIISDQVILTAAHCIRWGEENPKYQVKVGSDKKVYDIAKTFHNKNFDIDSNVLTGNDIALFVTKEKNQVRSECETNLSAAETNVGSKNQSLRFRSCYHIH